ncbi:hypothetical protein CEUSTIGMA_g4504.t1 [Chlamydomonas eustigma]|uniref:Uncharacterized protein n=1 Tax=Chlamydomonas eustigma TaxID=1157962 RepID=A0A250X1W1_9CHLO|nr:hypothetical protein CEUSTIGMA_g4504.t1 [Chlamydomonas eustigma]|eukprot:GAX77058.1 hypothetical protein CEUSTIGMA_g4504.t1 [Chlamydomonas eustigma]
MTASKSRMQALGRQTQPLSPNDGNLSVPLRVFASEHNRPAATVKTLVQKHFGDEGALIIDSEAYKHETESARLHKAQDLLDFQTKEKGRSSISAKKLRLERLSLRSKDENVRERILRSKAFSANVLANNLGSCNIPCPKAPYGSKESVNPVIRTSAVDSDSYNNQLSDAFMPHATLSSWVLHSHQAYASQNPPAASSMDSLSHLRIAKGNGSMQSALSKPSMGGQSSLKTRVDGDFYSQQCSPTEGAGQHSDHEEVECMPCKSRSGSSDEASHEKDVSCSVSIDSSYYSGSVSSEVNSHYARRMCSRRGVYPKPSRESPESAKAATVMCASPDEGQQNKGVLLAAVTEHVSQEQEEIRGGDGRGSRTLGTDGKGARMRLLTHQSATMLCTSVEADGNVESCAKSASKSARHNEAPAETIIGESSGMQALIQRIEASVMLGDVRAREAHPTSAVKVVPLETSQYRKHQSAVGMLKTTTADAHVRTSDLAHSRIGSTSSGVVGSAGRPYNGGR